MKQFCDHCGISMSMHDDPYDCEDAKWRVERLEHLERLFVDGITRRG